VTSPESFDRELIDHSRKSRDLRQLLGTRGSPPQCILNRLRAWRSIDRGSSGAVQRVACAELSRRSPGFSNRDHAPSGFGGERTATFYAAAATDLREVFANIRHAVT
jgi:hypothetical protein